MSTWLAGMLPAPGRPPVGRDKPTSEPEFRVVLQSQPSTRDAPGFPGKQPPFEGSGEGFSGELTVSIPAIDAGARRDLLARVSSSLRQQGFSDSDIEAFEVSVHELVDNVVITYATTTTLN
jgi:hypothetical protein